MKLFCTTNRSPALDINWTQYGQWNLDAMTRKYSKRILKYIVEREKGVFWCTASADGINQIKYKENTFAQNLIRNIYHFSLLFTDFIFQISILFLPFPCKFSSLMSQLIARQHI